jgi:hypothetical protein
MTWCLFIPSCLTRPSTLDKNGRSNRSHESRVQILQSYRQTLPQSASDPVNTDSCWSRRSFFLIFSSIRQCVPFLLDLFPRYPSFSPTRGLTILGSANFPPPSIFRQIIDMMLPIRSGISGPPLDRRSRAYLKRIAIQTSQVVSSVSCYRTCGLTLPCSAPIC